MPADSIYLDHNATTPIDPRVVEAMTRAWRDCGANPASQHAPGRRARRMLEEAREGILELLGAKTGGMDADQLVFTSGGTEANNLALLGLRNHAGERVLISAIEHPSVTEAAKKVWRSLVDTGQVQSSTPDDPDSHLMEQVAKGDARAFEELVLRYQSRVVTVLEHLVGPLQDAEELTQQVFLRVFRERASYTSTTRFQSWLFTIANDVVSTAMGFRSPFMLPPGLDGIVNFAGVANGTWSLVSVMLASNETGVIQPIADLALVWRNHGVLLHTDAVQAVGKIPVHFRELGVDAMTVAPHKFHGPLGIGALVLKHGVKLQPQLFGGFQQGGLRPGTENVALAVGFYEALKIAITELPKRGARMLELRNQLESAIKEAGRPEARPTVIVGEDSPRLPNTTCVSFPGLDRQALVMALDMAGVACSTGSACASGSSEPSPTLVAMGLPEDVIRGAIRLSIGAFTTAAEVAEASRRIINAVKHLRSQKSG